MLPTIETISTPVNTLSLTHTRPDLNIFHNARLEGCTYAPLDSTTQHIKSYTALHHGAYGILDFMDFGYCMSGVLCRSTAVMHSVRLEYISLD